MAIPPYQTLAEFLAASPMDQRSSRVYPGTGGASLPQDPPANAPAVRWIPSTEFEARFSSGELAAINQAAWSNRRIQEWLSTAFAPGYVDLMDARITYGLVLLVTEEILTTERMAELRA